MPAVLICQRCNAPLPPGRLLCSACGYAVTPPHPAQPADEEGIPSEELAAADAALYGAIADAEPDAPAGGDALAPPVSDADGSRRTVPPTKPAGSGPASAAARAVVAGAGAARAAARAIAPRTPRTEPAERTGAVDATSDDAEPADGAADAGGSGNTAEKALAPASPEQVTTSPSAAPLPPEILEARATVPNATSFAGEPGPPVVPDEPSPAPPVANPGAADFGANRAPGGYLPPAPRGQSSLRPSPYGLPLRPPGYPAAPAAPPEPRAADPAQTPQPYPEPAPLTVSTALPAGGRPSQGVAVAQGSAWTQPAIGPAAGVGVMTGGQAAAASIAGSRSRALPPSTVETLHELGTFGLVAAGGSLAVISLFLPWASDTGVVIGLLPANSEANWGWAAPIAWPLLVITLAVVGLATLADRYEARLGRAAGAVNKLHEIVLPLVLAGVYFAVSLLSMLQPFGFGSGVPVLLLASVLTFAGGAVALFLPRSAAR